MHTESKVLLTKTLGVAETSLQNRLPYTRRVLTNWPLLTMLTIIIIIIIVVVIAVLLMLFLRSPELTCSVSQWEWKHALIPQLIALRASRLAKRAAVAKT